MLKVISVSTDPVTDEQQYIQIIFVQDRTKPTRNILEKIKTLDIIQTFETLSEEEQRYMIKLFGKDWYFFLFSSNHIQYYTKDIQSIPLSQKIYGEKFLSKIFNSDDIKTNMAQKSFLNYQMYKYQIEYNKREELKDDSVIKTQSQGKVFDRGDIDLDDLGDLDDGGSDVNKNNTILDKLIDNFDSFDIITNATHSNDKIKLFQKNYIYSPVVSILDSLQEIQQKCAIVLRKKINKDQYFIMNSGDMNIYSNTYPLKQLFLSMEEKTLYKVISKMKETDAVNIMTQYPNLIINKEYRTIQDKNLPDIGNKQIKEYQIETLMVQTCLRLIPFGELSIYNNYALFNKRQISAYDLEKYLKLYYPYSPFLSIYNKIAPENYKNQLSNQIDFDPISFQVEEQMDYVTQIKIDKKQLQNKYFFQPYISQVQAESHFNLQYGVKGLAYDISEFMTSQYNNDIHQFIFKLLVLDNILHVIVLQKDSEAFYKRNNNEPFDEDDLQQGNDDIGSNQQKRRRQLGLKGKISEEQYNIFRTQYEKNFKQLYNIYGTFKNMDTSKEINFYEFKLSVSDHLIDISVTNNFNLILDKYEIQVLLNFILGYISYLMNTKMQQEHINFNFITTPPNIKFIYQIFRFKLKDYIFDTYKKNINMIDYNMKHSKFISLFYRLFLIDNKGYIRFLKSDNYLSKRILQNKILNVYNNTDATKQQIVTDFTNQLGISSEFIKKIIDDLEKKKQLLKLNKPAKYLTIKKNNIGIYLQYNIFQGEFKYKIQVAISEQQKQEIFQFLLYSHVFYCQYLFEGLHVDFVKNLRTLFLKQQGRGQLMAFDDTVKEHQVRNVAKQKFKIIDNVYYTSQCQSDRKPMIYNKEQIIDREYKELQPNLWAKDNQKAILLNGQFHTCEDKTYKHIGFLKFSKQCLTCCFMQDQFSQSTSKNHDKIKTCLGIDVQNITKYKKSNLIYVQNYSNKKINDKITLLPDNLDKFMNKDKKLEIKNMYLKSVEDYMFIKSRKNNHMIYSICKNIQISVQEFFNRISKIKKEDFDIIQIRIGTNYDNVQQLVTQLQEQQDFHDYQLIQEFLIIPGLVYDKKILLFIFSDGDILTLRPFHSDYMILLTDERFYKDSFIMYLFQYTEQVVNKVFVKEQEYKIVKNEFTDYYTITMMTKQQQNAFYTHSYIQVSLIPQMLTYMQFMYNTYYQRVFSQYEFLFSIGDQIQIQYVNEFFVTGFLINDVIYYLGQNCLKIPQHMLNIYNSKIKTQKTSNIKVQLDKYLQQVEKNNKTLQIQTIPIQIIKNIDYFLHIQYKIKGTRNYDIRDGNQMILIQIDSDFKNIQKIPFVDKDSILNDFDLEYNIKFNTYIREIRRSAIIQFIHVIQNNKELREIFLTCIDKKMPYLLSNKFLLLFIVQIMAPLKCNQNLIKQVFPEELYEMLDKNQQQQIYQMCLRIRAIKYCMVQQIDDKQLMEIIQNMHSISKYQFTNCVTDKKNFLCKDSKILVTEDQLVACVKYVLFNIKQRRKNLLNPNENANYFIRKDFIQGEEKIFNLYDAYVDETPYHIDEKTQELQRIELQLQILPGLDANILAVYDKYGIFQAVYLSQFLMRNNLKNIGINQIMLLQQNNVNLFIDDFLQWLNLNYHKNIIQNIPLQQIISIISQMKYLKATNYKQILLIIKLLSMFLENQIQYVEYKIKNGQYNVTVYNNGQQIKTLDKFRSTVLSKMNQDEKDIKLYVVIFNKQ